ncbi:hypothetical protein [Xanthobacter sp. 91]|uniref:hypothetical protein n=1 Tax=Xanthobacter sp. 91 TaxID=1117244 RepID=UPI000497CC7D|nr:hypothetical protein [Xanthobacter sp. 91]
MFDPTTLTGLHTWISLIAIILGIPVTLALMRGERAGAGITAAFLALAFLTSATGFLFPFSGVKPSHVVGAIALLVVLVATYALYGAGRAGVWRPVYAAAAVASLYFLVFVAVAQAFAKVPALAALAPTQSEPPFAIAQGVVLLAFVIVGTLAARARPASAPA